MRIALVSGSRSDRNALVMVEKALKEAGHKTWFLPLNPPINDHPAVVMNHAMSSCYVYMRSAIPSESYDFAVIHGDRYEIVAAALGLNVAGIPIAHIGGGDITEGSQDDCFRHAITKLSHMHFASNQDSADRIVQMGEEPERVHVTGCPGIDMVMATPVHDRRLTFTSVGLATPQRSILVLFHPNTLGGDTRAELKALSGALEARTEALVLLGPNADTGSDLIRDEWRHLAANRPNTVYHDNVAPQIFYSLLKHCDVLVGNSSAGFYEAPSFGIPAVDIGDRQKGRWAWNMLRPVPLNEISKAIDVVIGVPRVTGPNPYGDGHAAERIAAVIGGIDNPKALLRKKFRTCLKIHGGYCSLDEKLEPLEINRS